MVIFDATQPGTAADEWVRDERLRERALLRMGCVDEVLVIAAHPDDETLGAGGLIALCHESQIPVHIVCVTDGGASHPGEDTLPRRRATELTEAVTRLAPSASVSMLGFPDGKTREHRAAITQKLCAVLDDTSENAVLVVPWRGDGHRDHRVVGEIAIGLADGRKVLEYPIWMWHWAGPNHHDIPWDRLVTLEINPTLKGRHRLLHVTDHRRPADPTPRFS